MNEETKAITKLSVDVIQQRRILSILFTFYTMYATLLNYFIWPRVPKYKCFLQ